MKRKITFVTISLLFILGFISNSLNAKTMLTQEKALKEMFPDADQIVSETVVPTVAELEEIKSRLGGQLVHYQKGSESENVEEKTEFTFYYGMKDGKKTGVAVIEEQPGKWGPVLYIILVDLTDAKVKNLAVMSYREKRGRPIARRSFLKQFINKGSEDPIKVRKDIRAISGATISSDATCFAVKKVVVVVEEMLLKEQLSLSK